MALTDPSNVRVGAQRRALLVQKLAAQIQQHAQMARGQQNASARGVQGVGRSMGNSVDLRGAAAPKFNLPFALPGGRLRPAGLEEDNGVSNAPVLQSPGGLAAGGAAGDMPAADPGTVGAPPVDPTQGPSQLDPNAPAGFPMRQNQSQSDVPLNTPLAPSASVTPGYGNSLDPAVQARLNGGAATGPPDPYTMMMGRINQIRLARLSNYGQGI